MSAPVGSGSNPQSMAGINAARGEGGEREWANGGRIKHLILSIPIATFLIMLSCLSVYIYQLTRDEASNDNVICVSPVLDQHQYWRVFTNAWFHGGFFHIAMNMLAFYQIGGAVEDALGTLSTLGLTVLFPLAVGWMYIFLEYFWAVVTKDSKYLWTCALGYSGVIFAFLCLETGLAMQRGERTRRLFGMCDVPVALYPVVILIVISVVLPNISFVGHLSGIFVGLFYVRGLLLLFTFPRQWVKALERCLPQWLLNRPGWRTMPDVDPFAVWYPEFCRSNNCCPNAPDLDGGCNVVLTLCYNMFSRNRARSNIPNAGVGYRLGGAPAAPAARNNGPGVRPQSRLLAPVPQQPGIVNPMLAASAPPGGIEAPASPSRTVLARPPSGPIDGGVEMGASGGGHYARLEGEDPDSTNGDDVEAQLLNARSPPSDAR